MGKDESNNDKAATKNESEWETQPYPLRFLSSERYTFVNIKWG